MLSSKLDLCKSEWLELVFDDRNTKYGAYDLRKHYADNLVKALVITCGAFALLLSGASYLMTRHPVVVTHETVVDLSHIIQPPAKTKPIDPPKATTPPPVQHKTVAFPPPVVAPDQIAKNPPTLEEDKKSTIGQVNQDGTDGGNIDDYKSASSGVGAAITEDKTVYTTGTIEVMPAFPGGEAAWQKFLQKHLRYPPQAIDAGISGKVFISFIVETDGHLTDITLVRGVGYGLDDEAIRVLNIAPKWTPGIQNGHKVRVRYTMPFNFQAQTDNN